MPTCPLCIFPNFWTDQLGDYLQIMFMFTFRFLILHGLLVIFLFKQQRAKRMEAIKTFQKVTGKREQKSMLKKACGKIFEMISKGRAKLDTRPIVQGETTFPLDRDMQEALYEVLKNTAMFSEIVLRFTEIAKSFLSSNDEWSATYQWGLAYCNHMKHLLDSTAFYATNYAAQELNYVERHPQYVNPYSKDKKSEVTSTTKPPRKTRKPTIKKGPRLHVPFKVEL
ncbi:unnamed protein product [Acanthoscelides obtectus]|uniref:Uncharacterized protein n=1 Tax=Acanthoscelides obtectus TaxID=200917 RepID=A0A9P0LK98_ACAOB|nr:unnamed protein product [Acanthoscelides obtectus]CAK1620693.1 Coiled-coil domain-containing protein 134 [Acanthoscelides obtectus]